jgi:two-component system, NarL family, response regulator NreC
MDIRHPWPTLYFSEIPSWYFNCFTYRSYDVSQIQESYFAQNSCATILYLLTHSITIIMKTSIAIATRERLLGESFKYIVENRNIEVVSLEQEGHLAFEAMRKTKPDIALVDLDLPQMGGIEICKAIRQEKPDTRFIFFITRPSTQRISQAFKLMPHGFIHIEGSMNEMLGCINAVSEGKAYFSTRVYETWQKIRYQEDSFVETIAKLSNREQEILLYVGRNWTTKAIAEKLFICEKTIDNHKTRIGEKLGVKGHKALRDIAEKAIEWFG